MAQKQYTTYQADVLSFELRDALLGILQPGRYIGYDTFSEYQAQSGDNVYCRVTTTDGINKYDKTTPTPVLEAERGVAVTRQGTIIAEDSNVDVTIVLQNGGASSGVWHIIYMDHYYVEVQGANNATYGVKSGTDGGGMPTLDSPTKQVPIAYVWEPIGASQFSNLVFHKANAVDNFGDEKIAQILWGTGNGAALFIDKSVAGDVGTIPSDGAIGTRVYAEENFVTDHESITDSIDVLDQEVKDNSEAITTLGNTKLDDWAIPDDNTDLDASTVRHGLLPKLTGTNNVFLRGDGTWATPVGGRFVMRTGTFGTDLSLDDDDPDSGQIDLGVSGVPDDADVLIISVRINTSSSLPAGVSCGIAFRVAATGGMSADVRMPTHQTTPTLSHQHNEQVIIPCDSSQNVYYQLYNPSYLITDGIDITVVGWQTYTP